MPFWECLSGEYGDEGNGTCAWFIRSEGRIGPSAESCFPSLPFKSTSCSVGMHAPKVRDGPFLSLRRDSAEQVFVVAVERSVAGG